MDETIKDKISKILALGERAGTEAEASTAMQRAHALLAKHNLTMDEVRGHHEREEDVESDDSTPLAMRNAQWRTSIYSGIAKLYFCNTHIRNYRDSKSIVITGRPSNIAVVKHVAEYLVRTCDGLASAESRKVAQQLADDGVVLNVRAWAASFRIGFASRIYGRAMEEIAKAKTGALKDESTGTALVLSPLYAKEENAVAEYMEKTVGKLGRGTIGSSVRSRSGYTSGQSAGNQANMSANAIGGGASQKRLA